MKPILMEFPNEINTDRLTIRLPLPGDGKAVFEAIRASKKELKPWMPWYSEEQTEEDTESNVREAYLKFLAREDLRLHIFKKDTGEFVAASGLHRIKWNVPKFEIGYWINTRFSGNGYITEAVNAISDFAFNELKARRVEIRCDEKNIKSRAVAKRAGFQLDCILYNDDVSTDGLELRNTCIYSKTSL